MNKNLLKTGILVLLSIAVIAFAADTVVVFPKPSMIGWCNDSASGSWVTDGVTYIEKGRIMQKTITLPAIESNTKVTAVLNTKKFYDDMDRMGNVHVKLADGTTIELVHLVTSFGGDINSIEDVSYLAPLLEGEVTLGVFIDVWRTNAFWFNLKLVYEKDASSGNPEQVIPLFYNKWLTKESLNPLPSTTFTVPQGVVQTTMTYFTTGHGVYGNEFETASNIITIDNTEVLNERPWRTDCADFKDINPAAWASGSYKHSRTGWCPGAPVIPYRVDVTGSTQPGQHTATFNIPDISDKDDTRWGICAFLSCYGDIQTGNGYHGINKGGHNENGVTVFISGHEIEISNYTTNGLEEVEISLTDMTGKKFVVQAADKRMTVSNKIRIDAKSLDICSGVYLCSVKSKDVSSIHKVFINR